MKALPLWQPWASLVAVGAKQIETRHWPAPRTVLGQRIAIHATLTTQNIALARESEPFRRRLSEAAISGQLVLVDGALPLGALVATVVIDGCQQITRESAALLEAHNPDEHAFGDYSPGRYAWRLRDVETLHEPIPYIGSQGIFDVPDKLLGITPAQGALL